jgi:hypothetical protein
MAMSHPAVAFPPSSELSVAIIRTVLPEIITGDLAIDVSVARMGPRRIFG